ncbi:MULTISPECIES: hypothetical protein [unclassified Clostridium]|uniref:flavodoxin family protein n=1 Tax=unclassified Clostridium TaxID=2614128 RepID=UPI0002981253|nr:MULTISPECIES: hypothetical protein [unclassified Clostridium]EKQ57822.1 MAG: hypothetical protein A370_00464 [Clostridium sp. Maddingley MBC34-26]
MFKKILLSIVSIIVLIILSGITTVVVFKSSIDKQHASNEVIARSNNTNGKEALIIYQNCESKFPEEIASSLASGLNDAGYTVITNTAGDFLPNDISKYDIVILGGATLAGNVGEPLQNYAQSIKNYGNAKIILYSTGANKDNITEIDKLNSLLRKDPIKKVKFDYSNKEESKADAISLGKEIAGN